MANREIKFRAWDEVEKQMHYFDLYDIEKPGALGGQVPYKAKDGFEGLFSTWRKPLMQYTGLTDKNGKEIYENDAVVWWSCEYLDSERNHSDHDDSCRQEIGTVTYEESRAQFVVDGYTIPYNRPLEVAGNVFENPDLTNNPTVSE